MSSPQTLIVNAKHQNAIRSQQIVQILQPICKSSFRHMAEKRISQNAVKLAID